jgi:hypothetical protein
MKFCLFQHRNKIRNSKHEIRNEFQYPMIQIQNRHRTASLSRLWINLMKHSLVVANLKQSQYSDFLFIQN